MKRAMLTTCGLLIGLTLLTSSTMATEVEDALQRWESFGAGSVHVDFRDLDTCVNEVRTGTTRGDRVVLERLLRIADSRTQHSFSRAQAIDVACKLVDDDGARRVLEMMDRYLVEADKGSHSLDAVKYEQYALEYAVYLRGFLSRGCGSLIKSMDDQAALLSFLKRYYLSMQREDKWRCRRLIASCRVPLKERQALVLDLIEKEHGAGNTRSFLWPVFLELLDETNVARLRQLARLEAAPEKMNFVAVAALAFQGDAETAKILKSRLPTLRDSAAVAEDAILHYIWLIEIQNPPTNLLEYIAGSELDYATKDDPSPNIRYTRKWAVKRAVKLGIDPAEIRSANLQHAQLDLSPIEQKSMWIVKRVSLELGIMQESDLPEIVIHKRGRPKH